MCHSGSDVEEVKRLPHSIKTIPNNTWLFNIKQITATDIAYCRRTGLCRPRINFLVRIHHNAQTCTGNEGFNVFCYCVWSSYRLYKYPMLNIFYFFRTRRRKKRMYFLKKTSMLFDSVFGLNYQQFKDTEILWHCSNVNYRFKCAQEAWPYVSYCSAPLAFLDRPVKFLFASCTFSSRIFKLLQK